MRPETQRVVLYNAQLVSSFVDQLAQFLRPVDNVPALLLILRSDGLAYLLILPRRGEVELASSLELLLGFYQRVEDPLPVLEGNVGPECPCSLIEGMHLLLGELAIEDLKLLTKWGGSYTRDRMLPVKRLLFRKRLLAKY